MPRDEPAPRLWLRVAAADLDIARDTTVTDPYAIGLRCYHAQQAAEKSIKSVRLHMDRAGRGRLRVGVPDRDPLEWRRYFDRQ